MNEQDYRKQLEYVDTRGVWPQYVRGQLAVTLPGKKMDITVEDARAFVDKLLRG